MSRSRSLLVDAESLTQHCRLVAQVHVQGPQTATDADAVLPPLSDDPLALQERSPKP